MNHRLTPETLDENRLKRSVDHSTYELGKNLFDSHQVQVLDVGNVRATCLVQDKRAHRVMLEIRQSMVVFQCSCMHGSRGLICEHDVAAWLGVAHHLQEHIFPAWRAQVSTLIDTLPDSTPRKYDRGFLLAFSLQGPEYNGAPFWKIIPYSLNDMDDRNMASQAPIPETPVPQDEGIPFAQNKQVKIIDKNLGLRFKQLYFPLDPDACVNTSPDSARLANILLEHEKSSPFQTTFPIENYLPLLVATGGELFLAKESNPLFRPLSILEQPAELRLALNKEKNGLSLTAVFSVDSKSIRIKSSTLELISNYKSWVLAEDQVFLLSNLSSPGLLKLFSEKSTISIPAAHEDDFLDKYYLELARQMPLEGNCVEWEDLHTDPIPRLFLSDQNGEFQAQLRFGYGEAEVRFDSKFPELTIKRSNSTTKTSEQPDPSQSTEYNKWKLLKIYRQPDAEQAAFDTLSSASYGLKRAALPTQPGLFRLRARTHPVDFLLNVIPRLAQHGFEIFGEEQLKTARVNRNKPTIAFNVASGIDWFDVKAIINFGELEVELKDIRRVLRKKERYVKLADGSIGEIPEEWLERYKHLFALSEYSPDGLRVSRSHLALIDQALQTADRSQVDAGFSEQHNKFQALQRSFLESNFRGIQARALPDSLIGELRPYQKAGFDWLHFLHEFRLGGCLADDMGLGKTIQTLVFLQSLYGSNGFDHLKLRPAPAANRPPAASLLVVPRSLLVNWQREAARFTPNLKISEFFGADRNKDVHFFDQTDLVITTYGVMLRDIEFLHGYKFYYIILDESQAIKNPVSQTGRAVRLLQAQHHLALTGTPIENSTVELWSQFEFLNPGLLGSLEYFKEEFTNPIERKNDESVAENLRRLVFPFILRRTKDQVAPELPPRSERILYCDMSPAQRKLYQRTRDMYRGIVLGMLESEGLPNSRIKILEGLLRLRQICNHPILVDEKFRGDSGKFELLLETLETLHAEGHKALVFSQFVKMLRLVRNDLDTRNFRYAYLDGQTQNRQAQVDEFQANAELPFFLISLKAGGLGLNLTAADYVIHIDPWWNPAVEMQASDRTHRIGQDKPVFVFKLIARDSVEEKILQLQERKRNLVDQIIATEAAFFKSLNEEDVKMLFSE